MGLTCIICGIDFSVTPEAICILCESRGLGICMECSAYSGQEPYCLHCRKNLALENDGCYYEEEEEYYYEEV